MPMRPTRDESTSLVDAIDRVLDKGLVINADICVSVAGVELLGVKIRAALASFETAAKYGLEFPSGTNFQSTGWQEAKEVKEQCPQCSKKAPVEELMNEGCPWCGWISARAKRVMATATTEILAE